MFAHAIFPAAVFPQSIFPPESAAGAPPLAAGTLSASGTTPTTASLSWVAASGGTAPYSYQVRRAPDVGGSPGAFANVGSPQAGTTFTDSGLSPSTTYWYRVVVTDAATPTPATATSNQAEATTAAAPAVTPGVLSSPAHTAISVTLSATSATGGTPPLTYQLYASTASGVLGGAVPGQSGTDAGGGLSAFADGLASDADYYFTVVWADALGQSASSNQLLVHTAAATPGAGDRSALGVGSGRGAGIGLAPRFF